jgi:Dna[CI] antecedent, DciA
MTSSHHSNRRSSTEFSSGKQGFVSKNPNKIASKNKQGVEVNTLLKAQLSHLWPALSNIAACQKECMAALPQLFLYCQVMHLESEQLTLSAPNSALASKLKQQLPKLQASLQKAGWQINAIRIKVQVNPILKNESAEKQCRLSANALQAFHQLEKELTQSGGNASSELLVALRNLINRER